MLSEIIVKMTRKVQHASGRGEELYNRQFRPVNQTDNISQSKKSFASPRSKYYSTAILSHKRAIVPQVNTILIDRCPYNLDKILFKICSINFQKMYRLKVGALFISFALIIQSCLKILLLLITNGPSLIFICRSPSG